jgi:multiple RNA-binding domain-containing protein 1
MTDLLLRSTTRLCFKNFPLHYQQADLKRFILDEMKRDPSWQRSGNKESSPFIITDCRILKTKDGVSRRMAFVGLAPHKQSSTAAAAAIEWTTSASAIAQHVQRRLDKTYCATAKLSVEFAILPATPSTSNTTTTSESVDSSNAVKSKETKALPNDSQDDAMAKKSEFLSAMGVVETNKRSRTKVWANDDNEANDGDNDKDNLDPQTTSKAWNSVKSGNDSDGGDSNADDDDNDEQSMDDADPLAPPTTAAAAAASNNVASAAMDFLRSKQVARTDLNDDDKAAASSSPTVSSDVDDDNDDDDEVMPMKQQALPAHGRDHSQSPLSTTTLENDSNGPAKRKRSDSKEEEHDDNCGNDAHEMDAATIGSGTTSNNRLFLRNLPFTATEDDIRTHLQPYGTITECHIPVDDLYQNKGFAFVSFQLPSQAQAALTQADGRDFHGRLLHILPARQAPSVDATTNDQALTYKQKRDQVRQQEALHSQKGWMASFVRGDAVVDNLAERLGLRKGDILSIKDNLSSGDAAVRLALGETAVIEENRSYFANHGIDMEALVSLGTKGDETAVERSKTALLVKNLPHDTTKDDLQQIFSGPNVSILLPPSRTIAVVEYMHPNDAKVAFRKLAYRRFKSVPLYLEWVPLAASKEGDASIAKRQGGDASAIDDVADPVDDEVEVGPTFTLYVKNLNFSTTEEKLRDFFAKHIKDVRAVRVPQKVAPAKRQGEEPIMLSMGFGFVEFGSKESVQTALKTLQGSMLDDHALELKPSNAGTQDSTQSSKPVPLSHKAPCKLMVRNVPFQATRKELLQLFGSFGTLKKVRLPKKFDGSHRGFAFIEYLTGKEAANAMKVLSRTHLYGRHLVMEWAAPDEDGEDLQALREKAERSIAPKGKKIRFD